jgi:hypothetical protein
VTTVRETDTILVVVGAKASGELVEELGLEVIHRRKPRETYMTEKPISPRSTVLGQFPIARPIPVVRRRHDRSMVVVVVVEEIGPVGTALDTRADDVLLAVELVVAIGKGIFCDSGDIGMPSLVENVFSAPSGVLAGGVRSS